MTMMRDVRCWACGAAAGAGLATAAAGQDPDRLVVTASGRGEPLATAPSAISLLDSRELQLIDADHIQEALNRVPGVFLHRGSGQEHLTAIRSPVLTGGAGAGSFLYLEDGVPLRAAGFANVNGLFESVSDLASGVEVTRGPGSALYGSNAVHGLINVLTPAPTDDAVSWEVSRGSFQRVKASGALSRTTAEGGLLLSGSILDENGWRENAGADQQKALARWDTARGSWRVAASAAFVNLNQETAGFVRGDDIYRDSVASQENPNPEAFRDARSARVKARVEVDAGDALTIAVTPYGRWTDMTFLQHFLPSQALEENGQWSLGALSTVYWDRPSRFDLAAGLDIEFTRGFLKETQELASFGTFPQGVHYDYEVEALVVAPYAQADIALWRGWTLEVGGRLEATNYDYTTDAAATLDGPDGRFVRPADRSDDFLSFTPKAALVRETDDGVVYLRFARGGRAPQTTDLYRLQFNQVAGEADVERLDSVELGWRGGLGPVRVDAAAFAMEKDNFFFRDADGFNVSDGRTRHVGLESAIRWPIRDELELALASTYARHTYRFDRQVESVAQITESITSGDDVDSAPRWLANARLIWRPATAVTAELEWVFVDEYFMDAANTVTYPGHDVFNLRAEWNASEALGVYGAVRNLANTDYAERADFAFGSERYFPGEDRAFTVGLRGRF
ncbi:MAG: TonB-dependent receptor [Caulobacterales bacterium]|nr:TonB-dependent receptor [Caulobacterales bacterium]